MVSDADLGDIEAIKQLKARYFRCLDTKQWTEWRQVFTDDLSVRVDLTPSKFGEKGEPAPAQSEPGADAFVAHISTHLADYITVHHGHMPEIAITGTDTATGIWSMEDIVQPPGGPIMWGYGHYHEEYRRVDGGWRIASMYLKRLRTDFAPARAG